MTLPSWFAYDSIYHLFPQAPSPPPPLPSPSKEPARMSILARLEALEAEGVAELKTLWHALVSRLETLEAEVGLTHPAAPVAAPEPAPEAPAPDAAPVDAPTS